MDLELLFGLGLIVGAITLLAAATPQFETEPLEEIPSGAGPLYPRIYPILRKLSEFPVPRLRAYEKQLAGHLVQAAWSRYYSPFEFYCLQILSGAAGAGVALLLLVLMPGLVFPFFVPMLVLFVVLGFILPFLKLKDAVKKRIKSIRRDLPFTLDLLTISVEAGLEFTQALQRIVERGKPGPLRDEFEIVLQQISLGTPRTEALAELSERVNIDEMTSLTSLIIQSFQMGSSLGPSLRVQSELIRNRRMQDAEKRAQQAPVKMLFPLMLFIMPVVFVVILGPIILRLLGYGGELIQR